MSRSFNGTTDKIATNLQIGSIIPTNTSPCTASFWAYYVGGGGSFPLVVGCQGANNTPDFFFGINIGTSGKQGWNLYIDDRGSGSHVESSNNTAPSTNVWAHVLATYDGATTISVYVNGSHLGGTSGAGVTAFGATTPTMSFADGTPGGNSFFPGRLADVAFWTVVLTAGEISALANGARPYNIRESSLVGWHPLDGLASPEPDLSGNANNGTVTGTSLAAGPPFNMFTPRRPSFLTPPIVVAGAASLVFQRQTLAIPLQTSVSVTLGVHS